MKNEVEKVAGRRFAAYLIDFNLFTLPPPHFLISTCVNTHTRKLKRAPGGLSRNRKVNNKCTLGLCMLDVSDIWIGLQRFPADHKGPGRFRRRT